MKTETYGFTEDIRESYPELLGRGFSYNQLKEVYRDIVDRKEYPDFESWFSDMRKMSLIVAQ